MPRYAMLPHKNGIIKSSQSFHVHLSQLLLLSLTTVSILKLHRLNHLRASLTAMHSLHVFGQNYAFLVPSKICQTYRTNHTQPGRDRRKLKLISMVILEITSSMSSFDPEREDPGNEVVLLSPATPLCIICFFYPVSFSSLLLTPHTGCTFSYF